MSRTWSQYQQGIFNFVVSGTGNAIVTAVAGSGKTTTIVEAMRLIGGGLSALFLAFNKPIATELEKRGVNAKTFHALCYTAVMRFKRAERPDTSKLFKLCKQNLSMDSEKLYGNFIRKLVGLAKQNGIGCLVPDTYEQWLNIVEHHDIELDSDKATIEQAIELAQKLLEWSNASNMVDFDDMLYLSVKENLPLPKFNWIFVDEAQDTNAIQRAVLRKIMMPHSRLIAVGDPAQAIYGFRGADSNSMNMIAEEFKCITLPLSVSYRCATSIVEKARTWVSHIEPAEGAHAGVVERITNWDVSLFTYEDLVVCRNTKPLIQLAYKMMKSHIPVRIMGKDIGEGLIKFVQKMNAWDLDSLETKLTEYRAREVKKATDNNDEEKAESISDKVDAVLTLIDSIPEGERSVQSLITIIEKLFDEKVKGTTLATIHRSKGLEAFAVYWLNSSLCPSKYARQPWQQEQERNLCYVATTRAQIYLGLIEDIEYKAA
ncbi:MAG TPA: ATP-dependent helicase [Gammaproteobacteria bacterium]|nr:ATP-dependent helicase [Gammaproteobacteria bacterium]